MRLFRLFARVLFGAQPHSKAPRTPDNIAQPTDSAIRLPRDVSEFDREMGVIRNDISHLQAELRAHIVVGHHEGEQP